jgi:hypothetical protein
MHSNLGVRACVVRLFGEGKGLEFVACAGAVDAMFVFSSLHVNLFK